MTSNADENSILEARGLHREFKMGGEILHILRGVDLTVRHREWATIIGASGSGKSTLLHLLGALDRPHRGTLRFKGQDVFSMRGTRLDRFRSRHAGFIFQFYHLLPELNVLENTLVSSMAATGIGGWLRHRGTIRQRAEETLAMLGLQDRLRHRPAKLSGGERQRVAIARALMNQPDVLLADEPTGNLDAETGGQILDVLRKLCDAGQTIVTVTHDPAVAEIADTSWTLEDGRILPSTN